MVMDSGIARMGIFCFILIVAFAGIVALIPSGFFQFNAHAKAYDNPIYRIPSKWYGISIEGLNFSDTEEFNITTEDSNPEFDLGGRTFRLEWIYDYDLITGSYMGTLRLLYYYGFLNLLHEDMMWYVNETVLRSVANVFGQSYLYSPSINEDYANLNGTDLIYKVVCVGSGWFGSQNFYVNTVLQFNTTAYDTPFEAWQYDDLHILIGIDPTNENWNKDVWYVVSSIIMFNTFEVFGSTEPFAYVLNGIIWAMIFSPVIIFITAVLLEVLPF